MHRRSGAPVRRIIKSEDWWGEVELRLPAEKPRPRRTWRHRPRDVWQLWRISLNRQRPLFRSWVFASVAGWLAGGVIAALISTVPTYLLSFGPTHPPSWVFVLLRHTSLAAFGLGLGVAQWQVLRRSPIWRRQSAWWPLFTAAAWLLIEASTDYFRGLVYRDPTGIMAPVPLYQHVPAGLWNLFVALFTGAIVGLVQGLRLGFPGRGGWNTARLWMLIWMLGNVVGEAVWLALVSFLALARIWPQPQRLYGTGYVGMVIGIALGVIEALVQGAVFGLMTGTVLVWVSAEKQLARGLTTRRNPSRRRRTSVHAEA